MTEAYVTTDDGTWFTPGELARGPWHPDACHGGPPTALLVRALERLEGVGADQSLARVTVHLGRPVPMAGFRVEARVRHRGRTVAATTATLVDGDGRTCATADGLHLATVDLPTASAPVDRPDLAATVPGTFPIQLDHRSFTDSVEVRHDPATTADAGGPTTVWMSAAPIVAGEEPSPRQRLAPLADCGNGISWNTDPTVLSCINPDLTLTVLRDPVGAWFAVRATTHAGPAGIGIAVADLFDVEGLVGHVTQTLVLRAT